MLPALLYFEGMSVIAARPFIDIPINASGVYPAAVSGLNDPVIPHLSVSESYANNAPFPSAACSITIPPSVAPDEPEANKIYLSFIVKLLVFVNEAVPATSKSPGIVTFVPPSACPNVIPVWELSLPIVIVVHQEMNLKLLL